MTTEYRSARGLLGTSAVLFGVVALLWHDADTWQNLHVILRVPLGVVVGACLMIAQLIAGIALVSSRTDRAASIVLGVVYALFSLACIEGIVAAPRVWAEYGSFFEQFAVVCGALAIYASTERDVGRRAGLAARARMGFATCIVSFTVSQILYLRFTASLVPAWIPPGQMFWAATTTAAFGLAALAAIVNVQPRLALRLLTVMLALFAVLVWVPLLGAQPSSHGNWSELALTCLIAGASWNVAAVTTR